MCYIAIPLQLLSQDCASVFTVFSNAMFQPGSRDGYMVYFGEGSRDLALLREGWYRIMDDNVQILDVKKWFYS